MKILVRIAVIILVVIVQLFVVAQFTLRPVNLAKIPYRQEQRGAAIVAAARKMIDVIYSVWYNEREFYTHKSIPGKYIVP